MWDWTALDWSQGVVIVSLLGFLIWTGMRFVKRYTDKDGLLDQKAKAEKEMYTAWESYMASSKEVQKDIASTQGKFLQKLEEHGESVGEHAREACECLEQVVAHQRDHGNQLGLLIDAGMRACDVAVEVCTRLNIPEESISTVNEIKRQFKSRQPFEGVEK